MTNQIIWRTLLGLLSLGLLGATFTALSKETVAVTAAMTCQESPKQAKPPAKDPVKALLRGIL